MADKLRSNRGLSREDERIGSGSSAHLQRKSQDDGSGMQAIIMILAVVLLVSALVNTYFVIQTHSLASQMQSAILDNTQAIEKLSGGVGSAALDTTAKANAPTVATSRPPVTPTTSAVDNQKVSVIVLSDKRCSVCQSSVTSLISQLKTVFPGLDSRTVDYSTEEGKALFTETKLTFLPAFLFSDDVKTSAGYSEVEPYLVPAGKYTSLKIGADYDPTCYKEDGSVDCSKAECASKDVSCSAKDKPVVEVFVMAYCPYGTQIEKGLIPVVKALGNSIDFSVKFCDYAMHGEKEVREQMQQYCIETQQNDKYLAYLECFLKEGNSDACVKEASIDTAKLTACIDETDKKYGIIASFNDKTKWTGGNFPPFDIYKDLTTKYDVKGSPTFVVNGVVMDRVARDPQSLMDAICKGFTTKPAACSQKMDSATPSPGFGTATAAAGTDAAACAT